LTWKNATYKNEKVKVVLKSSEEMKTESQ